MCLHSLSFLCIVRLLSPFSRPLFVVQAVQPYIMILRFKFTMIMWQMIKRCFLIIYILCNGRLARIQEAIRSFLASREPNTMYFVFASLSGLTEACHGHRNWPGSARQLHRNTNSYAKKQPQKLAIFLETCASSSSSFESPLRSPGGGGTSSSVIACAISGSSRPGRRRGLSPGC